MPPFTVEDNVELVKHYYRNGENITAAIRSFCTSHGIKNIKDAPVYGVDSDEKVCAFIDKYVHCSIPSVSQDEELHNLVNRCQVHKCLKSKCKKKQRSCKYHFPRFPSDKTIICKGQNCDDYEKLPVDI